MADLVGHAAAGVEKEGRYGCVVHEWRVWGRWAGVGTSVQMGGQWDPASAGVPIFLGFVDEGFGLGGVGEGRLRRDVDARGDGSLLREV